MQEMIEVIFTLAFPVATPAAITVYLLYERDRTVKMMNETMLRIESLIKERIK